MMSAGWWDRAFWEARRRGPIRLAAMLSGGMMHVFGPNIEVSPELAVKASEQMRRGLDRTFGIKDREAKR